MVYFYPISWGAFKVINDYEEKIREEIANMPDELRESILSAQNISPEEAENERVGEESKKYENLPFDKWPDFEIKWDLNQEKRRFALDNFSEKVYAKHFPDGLLVGWINFNEFKSKLAKHSQRTKEELWETSSVSKLAKTILYFIEGNKMTPPLVRHDKDHCLTIGGGFHRIGVCLARDEKIIPILVVPSEKEAIQNILPNITWVNI